MNGQSYMDTTINYIHNKPESLKSKTIKSILSLFKVKKRLEKMMTTNKINQKYAALPFSLKKNYDITINEINGRKIWTFKPKNISNSKTLLYVHGGAYILNISRFQWKFVEELLIKTNSTVVVPDYPLAPSSTYNDAISFVKQVYEELLTKNSAKNIILIGDSAGGGFILSFAQNLRNEKLQQPSQIILLSPWLDISMSNPDIATVEKKDIMLERNGLKLAGQAYAGNLDIKNYLVSPIYGEFNGLGKVSVFIGTHDLFIADCRKFKNNMTEQKIPINYFEYPKMFHGWMVVTGLQEAKNAIDQIASLILK